MAIFEARFVSHMYPRNINQEHVLRIPADWVILTDGFHRLWKIFII